MLATKLAPSQAVTAAGKYRPVSVEGELSEYQNGKLPSGMLTPIGHGSHALYGPAADAFKTSLLLLPPPLTG